jgi:hypothetical protein
MGIRLDEMPVIGIAANLAGFVNCAVHPRKVSGIQSTLPRKTLQYLYGGKLFDYDLDCRVLQVEKIASCSLAVRLPSPEHCRLSHPQSL